MHNKFVFFLTLLSALFFSGIQTVWASSDNSIGLETVGSSGLSSSSVADGLSGATQTGAGEASHLFKQADLLQQNAFNSVARKAMPMTPQQIQRLKSMLKVTQRAAASSSGIPPQPVTLSLMVNLSPGATPPVIRLQRGFISSLVFVDANGQPWPIKGYDLGNPNAFNIQWQNGSNTLLVQATSMFTYGNLAVRLKGMATPVMLTLIPGQRVVDYRVDLHVEGAAPGDDSISGSQGLPAPATNVLLNVLNNISPKGGKELEVSGGSCDADSSNCRAWVLDGKMYLRIPMTVLSPGWISKMQSSDGMHAYEMSSTPSVLVSNFGKSAQLKIEGF